MVISNLRLDECGDLCALFGCWRCTILLEKLQIFGAYPGALVVMRDYCCSRFREDGVPGDVIEVVVGVDHVLHREIRDLANLREQIARRRLTDEGIDHQHAVVADDESGIAARARRNGCINAFTDWLES